MQKLYNWSLSAYLVIILLMIWPLVLKSQNDSFSVLYKNNFIQDITKLGDSYFFPDADFYPGKFRFHSYENVEFEINKLNFGFFNKATLKTSEYLRFLDELPLSHKQNLVRLFSFYEKDMEGILKNEGLPVELKYIAPVLSSLNQSSNSHDGKAGIWQLTHFQAVLNGGRIDKLTDDRLNVILSTRIAARELKQNFEIFGQPELAIAAYIYGRAKVKNAISLAGENGSYEEVFKKLHNSVNEIVAAYQAMAVFLNVNQFEHFHEPFAPMIFPDTVRVTRQLHFRQIESVIGIPIKKLQFYNPQYKFMIIPEDENGSQLVLPDKSWDDFVLWQDSIYKTADSSLFQVTEQIIEYPPPPNRQYLGEPFKDLEIEGMAKIQHRIKTGEVLGIIAEMYDVKVADLKYWNNINDERRIQAGQKLDVFVPEDDVDFYKDLLNQIKTRETAPELVSQVQVQSVKKVWEQFDTSTKIEYVVKEGESPYVIAKKYEGVTPDLILEWNNIDDPRKIRVGQKLILYLKR